MTRYKDTVSSLALVAALLVAPMTAYATSEETSVEGSATAQSDANAEAETTAEGGANIETETTMEGEAAVEGDTNMEAETTMEGEVVVEGDSATVNAKTAGDVDGTIMMQGENTVLAADLIGSTVYNMNDESIGDINDIIVTFDGQVEGVVIGVGGFLGMGEKEVAIELSAIELQSNEGANPRLYLDTTAEELEAAEEFVTARERLQLEQLQEAQEQAEQGTSN